MKEKEIYEITTFEISNKRLRIYLFPKLYTYIKL